jgi:hypothetical protein
MSENQKIKSKNVADNYRTEPKAELSDLSISTENKVFGGALSLLNKNQPSKFQNSENSFNEPKGKLIESSSYPGSPQKFKFDDKKININEIIDSSNALEPLSFRPSNKHIVEGLEKQIFENISHQEDSTNYTIQNTLTSSKNSTKKNESSKNEHSNNVKYIDEKKQTFSVSPNNFVKDEEEKEIYAEVEEKELANFEAEDESDDRNENVFWNLQNNVNQSNFSLKRSKSNNENLLTSTSPATGSGLGLSHPLPKNFNSSQITCVFSRIDKGNAIFVSSDDIIFALPMNFLPKNAITGNTYKITIEEIEKIHKKITFLQNMQ